MKIYKLNYTIGSYMKMLQTDDNNYTRKLYSDNIINKRRELVESDYKYYKHLKFPIIHDMSNKTKSFSQQSSMEQILMKVGMFVLVVLLYDGVIERGIINL
jgi:hypothetical protein